MLTVNFRKTYIWMQDKTACCLPATSPLTKDIEVGDKISVFFQVKVGKNKGENTKIAMVTGIVNFPDVDILCASVDLSTIFPNQTGRNLEKKRKEMKRIFKKKEGGEEDQSLLYISFRYI